MTQLTSVEPIADPSGVSEQTMTTSDGTTLFYRHWEPENSQKKALLLFHRGHEHSGRFADLVGSLGLSDFHVFAWDARGHGRSPGERGYAPSLGTLVRDLDDFVRHISTQYDVPLENMVILGHSVAAVLVSTWVHDYAPAIRAMVLATPAFAVKLYVPFAIPGLRVLQKVRGKSFIASYVRAKMLTHDAEQARAYQSDKLISKSIAVNILLDLHDTSMRIIDDAGAIQTPTLMLTAGSDWVVNNRATERFFARLGSATKQLHHYPGFYHAILHEKDRHLPIAAIRDFVEQVFRHPQDSPSLLDADKVGYTRTEYDRLLKPMSAVCPRHLSFAGQKVFLKTIPTLSEGIRLGWRTGFDSGQSLDYIYSNGARGITPLGKMIDRIYLNAIGWRGIRVRKSNLERLLLETIEQVRRPGEPVRLVDIAAGPGRYILDAIKKLPRDEVSALLRDRNAAGLAAGRKLAAEYGLTNVTYEEGDAFNFDSLASIKPRPDIAIVSGFYELFPDNQKVLTSLRGLGEALSEGGYLIYTNQPWHPQLEMIARVLINRDQKPWIMRRRSTAEMDQLVQAAGFEKLEMAIDEFGIFTVSVAVVAQPPSAVFPDVAQPPSAVFRR
jgi:alpha-beta hydrolase superfamily lysophospholipase/SAM-dependent methyltransferase